LQFANIDLQFE